MKQIVDAFMKAIISYLKVCLKNRMQELNDFLHDNLQYLVIQMNTSSMPIKLILLNYYYDSYL